MRRCAHAGLAAAALAGLAAIVACAPPAASPRVAAAPAYPPARTVDVVDDYHGTRVADPYRWLEELESPEVRAWAAQQTRLTTETLRRDPRWQAVKVRMERHAAPWDALAGGDEGQEVAGRTFRVERPPTGSHGVLTVRDSAGATRTLLDPAALGHGHDVARFQVAPDGRHVAVGVATGASEWVATHVVRVADGAPLEVVDGLLFEPPLWTHDGRGFFYVHLHRPGPGDRFAMRGASVRWHEAGTPKARDRVVHAVPEDDVELMLGLSLASGGRWLVIGEGTGAGWPGMSQAISRLLLLDLRDARAPDVTGTPVPLLPQRDFGYRVVASDGPLLHVLTDRGAPRKRVVGIDLRDPAPERWRDVIPEAAGTIHRVQRVGERYVVTYLEDAQHQVRVFARDGRLVRAVALPPLSSVLEVEPGARADELVLLTSSWLRPPVRTRHDLATGAATLEPTAPAVRLAFDTAAYEMRQLWYRAKDGARVPMFVAHRRGMALDGSHPVLLHGYGGSGDVIMPAWFEPALAWMEAGGVYAWPSLRGGGEFGRAWWEAAIRERKQVTYDDFIAAAEHLVAAGYTRPRRIAILGTSNGGTVVSAAMTQRPELFGVALPEVAITDALRFDRGRHRAQFGTPSRAEDFRWLHAWSPLHRVRAGTCYPATLVTTALNDDRSPAWQSLKLAAALQASQQSAPGCDHPVLLRADPTGGHAMDRGGDSFLENAADWLTFAMRQFAMTIEER